jgi:hypothetical protein
VLLSELVLGLEFQSGQPVLLLLLAQALVLL